MRYFVIMFCKLVFLFCALTVFAPGGESDARQEDSSTVQAASEVRTLSGLGENFEVILKFSSFEPGEEVPLTAYVLDSITNEPIKGAAISGGLSSGNASVSVVFKEAAHGLPGAYESKVRVLSDKPYSWLFDISLGEKSDLVAIDGFKAGKQDKGAPHPAAKEADYAVKLTPAMVTVVAVAFALLQAAILFFVRRRLSSRTPAKDLR